MTTCRECAAFRPGKKTQGESHRRAPYAQAIDVLGIAPAKRFLWPSVAQDDGCMEGVDKQA